VFNKLIPLVYIQVQICCILVVGVGAVAANDSLVGERGYTVFPIDTDKIRMISEKIDVRMASEARPSDIFDEIAFVHCEFLFENISNEPITAKVGFPGRTFYPREIQDLALSNFEAYIDGEKKEVLKRKELLGAEIRDGEYTWTPHRYWYVWDVDFPAKGRVKIANSYSVRLSSNQEISFFQYVMTTGKNWHGPIGRAKITVRYADDLDLERRFIYASPTNYIVKGNTVTWEFEDFVPDREINVIQMFLNKRKMRLYYILEAILKSRRYEGAERDYTTADLEIEDYAKYKILKGALDRFSRPRGGYLRDILYYIPGGDSEEDIKKGLALAKRRFLKDVKIAYVRMLRNEIYARHGRSFNSMDLRILFSETNWYEENPDYTDDLLTDIERRNIQFIVDYERQKGWRE